MGSGPSENAAGSCTARGTVKKGKAVEKDGISRNRAILYIILAAAYIAALIYVDGLFIQICAKLIDWMFSADGFFQSGSSFPPIRFGYLLNASYTFTVYGLIIGGIALIITAIMIVGRRRINRRKPTIKDDRGFQSLETGMYGTAGWMTEKEMRKVLDVEEESTGREFVLGKNARGELLCLPENEMGDNQNIIVFGPPGTGKTRCIIINHIIAAMERGESVIVPDTKGELYNMTADTARKKGYEVKVFNLIDPDHSDSWNILANADLEMEVGNIAQTITNNTGSTSYSDPFWANSELNLLKAVMLHVMSKEPPEAHNLPFVYKKLLLGTEGLRAYIGDGLTDRSPEWSSWSIFNQNVKDTTQGSFVQGLATKLQILQNPKICSILEGNSIDLSMPAQKPCVYYMILDTQNSNMEFLSSLFFTFLFERLIHWADTEGHGRCIVPVRIILDEFTNLGRLGISADGSDFVQTLSLTRSRFINTTMAVQTYGQLQTKYPRQLSSALLGNTAYWLLLGCNDELTAKLFSDRSGDMTVEVRSERTARRNLTLYQYIPEYMENEGAGKRKLVNPDEVQRMKQVFGDRAMLISMEGHNMIKAEKFDYSENAACRNLQIENIGAYTPSFGWRQPPAEDTSASALNPDELKENTAAKKAAEQQTDTRLVQEDSYERVKQQERESEPEETPVMTETPDDDQDMDNDSIHDNDEFGLTQIDSDATGLW